MADLGSRGKRAVLAGVLGVLWAAPARADRSFDFAPTPAVDAYGMTIIDRAQTPQRFEFGMQAVAGWASAPFQPVLADAQSRLMDARFRLIDHQFTVDIGFYLGLWDFLSVAGWLAVGDNIYDINALGDPIVLGPKLANPTATTPLGATGIYANQPRQNVTLANAGPRDPRLAIKVRFFGGRYFETGMLLETTLPLGNSTAFLGDKSATFRPRLLAGLLLGRFNVALSFGAIVRPDSQFYDPYRPTMLRFEVGHELTWGVGLGARLHRLIGLGLESFGLIPVAGDATFASADLLGALLIHPTDKLRLTLSASGGLLPDNPRKEDVRLLVGLSYSLSPQQGGLP